MRFARWTSLPVALLVMGLTLVWGAAPAAACSCEGAPFEVREGHLGVEAYEAVFVGTVTSNEQISSDQVRWVFEVESVLHGEVASPIALVTAVDGGACGLDWVSVGSTIAVGVNTWNGDLSTGLCSVDREAAVDGIGERRPPLNPGDPLAVNSDQVIEAVDIADPDDELTTLEVETAEVVIDVTDETPSESTTSQIIVVAIGILSILGAAVLTAVLARRSD